jgi:hypothetical protein
MVLSFPVKRQGACPAVTIADLRRTMPVAIERRTLQRRLFLAAAGALMARAPAHAQQRQANPTIAFLCARNPSSSASRAQDAFRGRRAELGYVEGRNIVVEVHYLEG